MSSTGSSVSIRLATSDDALETHRIAVATFPLACTPGTPLERIERHIAENLTAESFERYLADPETDVLLAESGGVAVGYSMLVGGAPDAAVVPSLQARPALQLSKFYLLAELHGRGAAAALMDATLTRAAERGASVLWLGANPHSAQANRFYEKHGFEVAGSVPFTFGGVELSDVLRMRELQR
jgi:ribosomal protein S18 acetylase RimI-like enzyme